LIVFREISADDPLLRASLHFDRDSRPTAQILADTFHGRENRQPLAVASGLGRRNRKSRAFFCGKSAGAEPALEGIMSSSFAWVDRLSEPIDFCEVSYQIDRNELSRIKLGAAAGISTRPHVDERQRPS
jgi:hypothetical protein